jgi:membrane-associated phospholipid phosphatase
VNKRFTYYFLIFWSLLSLIYGIKGSQEFHIALQSLRVEILDVFFLYATRIGEEYVLIPAILLMAIFFPLKQDKRYKIRVFYSLLLGLSLAGALPQIGKFLMSDALRPIAVLHDLEPIEGLVASYKKSFPSGHTSITVAWVSFWSSLAFPKLRVPLFMACTALTVAISRIYLNMHWLHDVIVGGFLGFLSAYIGLWAGGFNKTS